MTPINLLLPTPSPEDIKAARARAGLTQTQAGAMVGVAMRTWQDWEAGIAPMPRAIWSLFSIASSLRLF